MDALRSKKSIALSTGFKFISVHRGLHFGFSNMPENSLTAIKNASNEGFESIELDIKVTKDKVPVLSHDINFARMTYNAYDPFNASNADPTTPDIPNLNITAITNLRLRKINFDSKGDPIYTNPIGKPHVKWVGKIDDESVSTV